MPRQGALLSFGGRSWFGESTHFMPKVRVFFCRRESFSPFSLLREPPEHELSDASSEFANGLKQ